ncbi:TBC LysM-associated domain containing 2 [Conglomerata obtusa]
MNYFRKLFKRKKEKNEPEPSHLPLPLQIMNFKYLYNNELYTPRILTNYFKLKCTLEKKYQACTSWSLAYSTHKHGYSLKTMHLFLSNYDGPFLFIIKECNGNVFGCFFEESVEIRKAMFGRKSTFLFKVNKSEMEKEGCSESGFEFGEEGYVYNVKTYRATGKNLFFCTSHPSFLAFGCGDGFYGLLLNKDLQSGESHVVETFNNEILASNSKFSINEIEIWHLQM